MPESTLKEKTSKGLFWGGTGVFVQQLLSAAFGIYLARTLSPSDYGLVGMLAIFSLIANLFLDGGFGAALINRKEIAHDDYNAVFWFNILVATICAIALFFAAPWIASYFHHSELIGIARWYAVGYIMSGFGPAQRAYLSKKMMFKEISIVTTISLAITGCIGVYIAWRGYAYWALVAQSVVPCFLINFGFWLCSDWRPSFRLNLRPLGEMIGFTIKLFFTSVINIIGNNYITVLLGRYFSSEKVGFYTQANKWSSMGTSVMTGMVGSVVQPVLASVTEDKERQLRVFRKLMRFASFVSFPALLGLAFVSPEFITLALTDKWMESVKLMRILCIGGAFAPLISICSGLIVSRGRSDMIMWSNVFLSIVLLSTVLLCHPYGVATMVVGITAVNIVWILVWLILVNKEVGYTFLQLLADVLPFMGITVVSIVLAWLITWSINNLVLLFIAKVVVTASIYMLLMRITSSVTYRESIQFFKDRLSVN